ETVSTQVLKNELNFYGKITVDKNKLIEVFPVVGGKVDKILVELGDYVEKNQLLATIKSIDVANYAKELEDAKNELILAQEKLKINKEMYEGKLATDRDMLEAKTELSKAQSQFKRIQETFNIYNMNGSATYEVRAPIDGFIVERNINQEMLLRNDRSNNIFDVAQIKEVWAIANVNESDIKNVKIGVDAEVTTISYPDKIFKGKVDKLFNMIDPETKAMSARIKLANNQYLLKPAMSAHIKLSFMDGNTKMIAIPAYAVIFDNSKNFVMIFKDRNNLETRQVEVFRQIGNTTYIAAGLKEGEKIITQNQLLIYDALND
ncbi:MAG: efflux RND transporter periplasmic adaptor subunit, partial [Sediminibacterium sp.]|nr:efflux RND transporter periplasmic adaptor subunit [Sediminibacterium sp.]